MWRSKGESALRENLLYASHSQRLLRVRAERASLQVVSGKGLHSGLHGNRCDMVVVGEAE